MKGDKFGQGLITANANIISIRFCNVSGKAVSASVCVNVRRHGLHSYVKEIINRAILLTPT